MIRGHHDAQQLTVLACTTALFPGPHACIAQSPCVPRTYKGSCSPHRLHSSRSRRQLPTRHRSAWLLRSCGRSFQVHRTGSLLASQDVHEHTGSVLLRQPRLIAATTRAGPAQVPDLQQQVASLKLQLAAEANRSSAMRANLSTLAQAAPAGMCCLGALQLPMGMACMQVPVYMCPA